MTESFSIPAWRPHDVNARDNTPHTDSLTTSDLAEQPVSDETISAPTDQPVIRPERPTRMPRATARCRQSRQHFYLSLEAYEAARWIVKTAFPVSELSKASPGGHHRSISGSFTMASTYPGCPHCQAERLFQCSCGDLACWDGSRHAATCPSCSCIGERGSELENLSVDM